MFLEHILRHICFYVGHKPNNDSTCPLPVAGGDCRRQCSAVDRSCVWSAQIYALRCAAWAKAKKKKGITMSWVTSGQCGSTTSRLTHFNKLPSHSQKFALLLFFKLPIEKLCPFAISQTDYSKMVLVIMPELMLGWGACKPLSGKYMFWSDQ